MFKKISCAVLATALLSVATPGPVFGSAELDRSFALESVGVLRSADNVDGLFVDYVAAAYRDFFSRQSRFVLQDIARVDTVLSRSNVAYSKLIQDPQILGQVARATRSESLIRTQVLKEGRQYRFTVEWLHSPQMEKMSEDTFVLPETALSEVQLAMQRSLERLIAKVPFIGNVTGRDADSITVNLGSGSKVFKGDTLVVATLDEAKKHPLLKAVVDWRLTPIGKVEIETVDEKMAFGRVIEEEEGRKIARYQKVTQIIPKPLPPVLSSDEEKELSPEKLPPRLGFVSAALGLGSFGRQYAPASTGAASGFSGSGLFIGPRAEAQLWVNKTWFAEFGLGYGFWGYSQSALNSGDTGAASSAGSVSANLSSWKFNAGYSYLLTSDFFGPKGVVRMGYQSFAYTFPVAATEKTAPVSFKGLFLGIGGELPVRGNWGALVNLDFGLFPSASESAATVNAASSVSMMGFSIGGFYRFAPRLSFRTMVDISAQSADFSNGLTLSHKVLAITPALLYYF